MRLSEEILEELSKALRDTEHRSMAKELLQHRAAKKVSDEALENIREMLTETDEDDIFNYVMDSKAQIAAIMKGIEI